MFVIRFLPPFSTLTHVFPASQFTERTPGSFVEAREASMVWRFWTGEPSDGDSADRQWARRQAAEAQNHIFDRYVSSIYFILHLLSISTLVSTVSVNGTVCASSLGRTVSSCSQTTSREPRHLVLFFTLVGRRDLRHCLGGPRGCRQMHRPR